MAGLSTEYFWGMIAIISGGFIIRGALKPIYSNLQFGALIGFFHWSMISVLYFMGDWTSTGGISAAAFAAYSGMVWLNLKVNKHYFKK